MAGKPHPTLADYAVIAISPALIMTLVGSLVFFLVEVFYQGGHGGRLSFILALFVLAAVCVARISIEQGRGYAAMFALPLGVVVVIAMLRFVQFQGPLAPFSSLVNIGLVALIWWCADKLTWDCTVIDEQQDMSGQGLMQTLGWEHTQVESGTSEDGSQVDADGRVGAASNAGAGGFWQRFDRGRRRPHAPGVWVIYFSLAALPIFGIGQGFLSQSDLAGRRYVFQLLMVYLASALGLLLNSSFLALRRYLRQRNMEMPGEIARVWLGSGVIMIVALLLFCTLLPRRNPEYSMTQLSWFARSPNDLQSSRWAWGKDGVPGDSPTSSSTELASAQSSPSGDATSQADPTSGSPATPATRPQGSGTQSQGSPSSASSPVQGSDASGKSSQGNVSQGASSQGASSQGSQSGSRGGPDSRPGAASRSKTMGSPTGGETRRAGSHAEGPRPTRSGTENRGASDNVMPDSAQQAGQRSNETRDSSATRSQPSTARATNRSESSPSGNSQPQNSQAQSSQAQSSQAQSSQPNNTQPNNTQPNNTQPNNTQPKPSTSDNSPANETPPRSAPRSGDAGENQSEPERSRPDSQPASTDSSAASPSANNDTHRSASEEGESSAQPTAEPPAEPSAESSAEPSADAKQDREGSNASSRPANENAGNADRGWDFSSWTSQIGPLLGGFFQAMYWLLAAAVLAFLAWRYWATVRQAFAQFLESLRAWLAWLRGESVPLAEEPAAGPAKPVGRPFRDFRDPFRTGDAQRMSPDQLVSYSFQALEAFCREQGRPRSPDETPLEFAQAVGRDIQRLAQPAAELAELYNWSAYSGGGLPVSARPRLQHFWRCLLTVPPSAAEEI